MEKKLLMIAGAALVVLFLILITKGAAVPFLFMGVLAYLIYKNNR